MVGDPDPVVGALFRPGKFVKPQPKHQVLHGRVRWSGVLLTLLQLQNKAQAAGGTSQTGGGIQNKAYG